MPLISRLGSFSSGAFGFGKPSSPAPGPAPAPVGGLVVEYLIVGGGGGGGAGCEGGGGGGGGGEVRQGCTTLYDGINYTVIVGKGGPSSGPAGFGCQLFTNFPESGSYSCLGDLYSAGGARGGGQSFCYQQIYSGQPGVTNESDPFAPLGGQGGGGGGNFNPTYCNTAGGYYYYDSLPSGGAGLIGPAPLYPYRNGGGGGGGGGLGGDANTTCGGAGGIGATSCITGVLCYYGGGGGGGSNRPGTGALGGCGGGGRGGTCVCSSSSGTIFTGGGGGGGAFPPPPTPTPTPVNYSGSSGGSGTIIIAYPSACGTIPYIYPPTLVRSLDTTTRPGYNIYSFCQRIGTILFNYGSAILSCILVVGGGGGGGANGRCLYPLTQHYGMGGGGGGGVINSGAGLCKNINYTISIGAGAPITPATNPLTLGCGGDGLNGSNTSITGPNLSLIACGGGGGGGGLNKPGKNGGSGGGSGTGTGAQPALNCFLALGGLSCLNNQGTSGGIFTSSGGSGGGGGLLNGCSNPSYPGPNSGGFGGQGCTLSITGTSLMYGAGGAGGGGCCGGCQPGNGGCGGSSEPPYANRSGTSGAANFGGGGGGAAGAGPPPGSYPAACVAFSGNGGGGGSGVLILRYPYPTYPAISCVSPGLTYACSTSVPGVLIYCFTAGAGTICFV